MREGKEIILKVFCDGCISVGKALGIAAVRVEGIL